MVVCGLIFHYFIAVFFTAALFWLYPRIVKTQHTNIFTGIIDGFSIWIIMNYVVLLTTNITKSHGHLELISLLKGVLALIICVVLPVTPIADYEMPKTNQPA